MNNIHIIYIGLFIIITIGTIYLYIDKDQEYRSEMRRIYEIEKRLRNKNDFIDYNRKTTTPCSVENLTTPRDCFIHSNYRCKWNEFANRCNKIEY